MVPRALCAKLFAVIKSEVVQVASSFKGIVTQKIGDSMSWGLPSVARAVISDMFHLKIDLNRCNCSYYTTDY